MAPPKYYGVRVGNNGFVFDNWSECSEFVKGRRGCRYKSFFNEQFAEMFADGNEAAIPDDGMVKSKSKTNPKSPQPDFDPSDGVIRIWTDGATSNNGSTDKSKIRAGVGVFFPPPRESWSVSEPFMYVNPTNQRAEILAIIRAIQVLDSRNVPIETPIVIYTDSMYCVKAHKAWIPKWNLTKCNWTTTTGTSVKNKALLKHMDKLIRKRKVQMVHINGHCGIPGNEAADRLAVAGCVLGSNTSILEYKEPV